VVTVSEPIADELKRRLKVEPIVVLNAPELDEREPTEPPPGLMRAIYQGAFGTGRPLEDLLAAIRLAPSVQLTLRVNRSTRESLQREVPADLAERITVEEPVPPQRVIDGLQGQHVGVLFDRPLTRNAELSLPNKLFEYLGAGLAVVAPRLEGLSFVDREQLGRLFDPSALLAVRASRRPRPFRLVCARDRVTRPRLAEEGGQGCVRDVSGRRRAHRRIRSRASRRRNVDRRLLRPARRRTQGSRRGAHHCRSGRRVRAEPRPRGVASRFAVPPVRERRTRGVLTSKFGHP